MFIIEDRGMNIAKLELLFQFCKFLLLIAYAHGTKFKKCIGMKFSVDQQANCVRIFYPLNIVLCESTPVIIVIAVCLSFSHIDVEPKTQKARKRFRIKGRGSAQRHAPRGRHRVNELQFHCSLTVYAK